LLQYNYGGIQAKNIEPATSQLSQDPTQNGANEIISSWNVAEYLPTVMQVCANIELLWEFFDSEWVPDLHTYFIVEELPLTNLWCLYNHLQDYFVVILSEYIYKPWKYLHDQASLGSYVGAQEGSGSQLGNASYVNHMEAQAISYLKDQVNITNLPPSFHLLVPFCNKSVHKRFEYLANFRF
jgi:hypothetical protein